MDQPNPLGRRALAHQAQFFASHPPLLTAPVVLPVPAVYPDQLLGRPARAHEYQFWAGPNKAATPTVLQPLQPTVPQYQLRRRPPRAHEYQAFASPGKFVTPVAPAVLAYGATGAATFVLELEPGCVVTFGWQTNVITSYSGREQRESPYAQPRRRIEGSAFLVDARDRDLKGALVRAAAQGSTFLLALPFEELSISADSPGSTVTVASTALCDWAIAGQRVAIVAKDSSATYAVVQSSTSTTISVTLTDQAGNFTFGALGSAGASGGRIVPLVPVLLDPSQGFARYPVTVGLWSLRATASAYGWVGTDSMGVGALLATYDTDGAPVAVATVTDDDILIWDRSNGIQDTSAEVMISRTEVVDLGGIQFAIGGATVPDWGRTIRLRSSSPDDWAWLKAFLRHARGRQVAFLLSTGRPDFVFSSLASGVLAIQSASVSGGNDYLNWFDSTAHHHLALTTSTGIQYVRVLAVADNGNGTLSLTLDSAVTGSITKVSLAEMVRFVEDNLAVSWDGGTFDFQAGVVTAQDAVPATQAWFSSTVTATFNGVATIADIPIPFSYSTVVNLTFVTNFNDPRSGTIGGVTVSGGNLDGMIIVLPAPSDGAFTTSTAHENGASVASSRFRNQASATISSQVSGSLMYVYCGSISRWVQIGAA